jgi:hypothetical protein
MAATTLDVEISDSLKLLGSEIHHHNYFATGACARSWQSG